MAETQQQPMSNLNGDPNDNLITAGNGIMDIFTGSVKEKTKTKTRDELMVEAKKSAEKETLTGVGTKLAFAAIPALAGAAAYVFSKNKNKRRNAMLGFMSGVKPGSEATKSYFMENQQQAYALAQDALNDPQIPDEIKVDPTFLTGYVKQRMGDKEFDKSAFSLQVKKQINSYYDTSAETMAARAETDKNFRTLNHKAFSQRQALNIENPNGAWYTTSYDVFTPERFEDAFNEKFKELNLPPMTLNNRGSAPGGGIIWKDLSVEQRAAAIDVMKSAGIDNVLIGDVLPDTAGEQMKVELAKARLAKAKAQAVVKEKLAGAKGMTPAQILSAAKDLAKENGGDLQDYVDEVLAFTRGERMNVNLAGYADKEKAKSLERQYVLNFKIAQDGIKANGWDPSHFETHPDYIRFKASLPSDYEKSEATRIWEALQASEDAGRRASIWSQGKLTGDGGGSAETKKTDGSEPIGFNVEQMKAAGHTDQTLKDGVEKGILILNSDGTYSVNDSARTK